MLTDHLTSAADAAATDTNGRDRSRVLQLAGLALAGMLALTACSGDSEGPDDDGSSATEAAPAEESDDASQESPAGENSESRNGENNNSTTGRGHDEYVPASAEGPAQNVPEPELPDEASRQSAAGVEASVEHFWDTDWFLANTGETSPLENVSHDDCNLCIAEINYFTELYNRGGWYASDPDTITTFDAELTGEKKATAWAIIDASDVAEYESDGEEVGTSPATYGNQWKFQLVYQDDRWIMKDTTHVDGTGSETPESEE